MQQLVRVRQIHEDGTATVIHVRESACSGDCHKCSGCGAAKEVLSAAFRQPLLEYGKRGAAAACVRIARRIQGQSVPVKL